MLILNYWYRFPLSTYGYYINTYNENLYEITFIVDEFQININTISSSEAGYIPIMDSGFVGDSGHGGDMGGGDGGGGGE